MPLKKVAYLLGAGATHAEILTLEVNSPNGIFRAKNGLLISDVSKRVMKNAQTNPRFKKNVEQVTFIEGPVNIELLISLFESNRISDVDFKVTHLKKLVHDDITQRLSPTRKIKFYLHKALFELHGLVDDRENLIGIISLNYDDVLDDAYERIHKTKPNHCHTSDKGDSFPLLQLHGSFSWTNIKTYGKTKAISITSVLQGSATL